MTSKDFEGIRADIERIAREHQGYIGQLELNTVAGSSRSLTVSLQVPASQLDSVIGALKQLGHVNSESQSGQDVTQRSVDLDARLTNLQMTEMRLQQLLRERTGKLGEVLEVEEAVDRIRGEIETAQAERKSLSNQISFATVRLSVSEEYKAQLENNGGSVVTRLRNSAVEGYQDAVDGVITTLVFLLSIGPTLLITIGIGFFPALWIWRRFRRRGMTRAA
jgi:hypothetical protein